MVGAETAAAREAPRARGGSLQQQEQIHVHRGAVHFSDTSSRKAGPEGVSSCSNKIQENVVNWSITTRTAGRTLQVHVSGGVRVASSWGRLALVGIGAWC